MARMAEQDVIKKRKHGNALKIHWRKFSVNGQKKKPKKSIEGKVSFYLAYSKYYPKGL
jgi:hypothetical protein